MFLLLTSLSCCSLFFFNDTATTEIYTLSLHDALPISPPKPGLVRVADGAGVPQEIEIWQMPPEAFGAFVAAIPPPLGIGTVRTDDGEDRKSTRLNSSHQIISYAVFCLKKKKKNHKIVVSYFITCVIGVLNRLLCSYVYTYLALPLNHIVHALTSTLQTIVNLHTHYILC